MLPVSIFFITKNEVDRLGDAIRAVRHLSDDIVVVDSGSTDGTQALAEELGARVIHHDWPGFGPQKRFAEEQCRHTWLLNLDADEVVPPKLAGEIEKLFENGEPPCQAYEIAIAEIFPGEKEPHPWAYSLAPVRLYRKDKGRYSPSIVHDRVELQPGTATGRLKTRIHHRSVRSLGAQFEKLNKYTDQQAIDLENRGVRIPVWRVYFEFPAAFFKAYFGRRHFVRGTYGFLTAVNYAIARHMRLAKHYERRRFRKDDQP